MSRQVSSISKSIVLVTLLAAVLRFAALGAQPFWYDEVYTLNMLRWPLSVILTVRDGHPPLFHLALLPLVPLFGEMAPRLFSAVIGTATVPLLMVLASRMFDRRAALWTGVLLAISPLHIWYSREGRMYALCAFFAVVSSLAAERVVRSGGVRAYTAWALAAFAGLMTHYGFAAVLLAQVVFLGGSTLRSRGARALVPLAVVGALALTMLLPLARELAGRVGAEGGFHVLALPYTAVTFLAGYGIGPTVSTLHWSHNVDVLGPFLPELAVASFALVCLALLAVRALPETGSWGVYVVVWLLLAPLMLTVRSLTAGTSPNVRYVIGSLPAFLLLVGFGLSRARPWIAVSVMALVVALSGLSLARDHYDVRYQREDMRAAAHFVVTHSVPEDRIVVAAEEQRLTLRYYLEHEMRRGRIIEKLPLAVVNTSEDALRSIDGWRSDGRRTWVVLSREWGEDPGHILRTALLALGPNARQAEFPGADVFVVDAVPGAGAGDRTR